MKRYLTEAEQRKLLQTIKGVADPLAQRDYHWVRSLILTGARITEWSLLTVPRVELALQTGWLVIPKEHRKGGKAGHEYPVSEPLRESLRALLMMARSESGVAPAGSEQPLIMGRDGLPLSVRSYQHRLKGWVIEAQLDPRVTVHWLRHTRGMNILRNSTSKAPLRLVKAALGHRSMASTGVYLEMSREEYAEGLRQVDGGRLRRGQAVARTRQALGGVA